MVDSRISAGRGKASKQSNKARDARLHPPMPGPHPDPDVPVPGHIVKEAKGLITAIIALQHKRLQKLEHRLSRLHPPKPGPHSDPGVPYPGHIVKEAKELITAIIALQHKRIQKLEHRLSRLEASIGTQRTAAKARLPVVRHSKG